MSVIKIAPAARYDNTDDWIDEGELQTFVARLFRHARTGEGLLCLRSFSNVRGGYTNTDWALFGAADQAARIAKMAQGAGRAAAGQHGRVFAPPVALFHTEQRDELTAGTAHVVFSPAIAVDLDSDPAPGLATLERVLGPASLVVETGGIWNGIPKVHAYWILREPARDRLRQAQLKLARRYARALAGGDPTAESLVHPMRWAGSLHTKVAPKRLVRIAADRPDREIDLEDATERLLVALSEAGIEVDGGCLDPASARTGFKTKEPLDEQTLALLADRIPNEGLHWNEYRRLQMAFFDASHGDVGGLEALHAWAAKDSRYDPDEVDISWAHFAHSPPSLLSAQTLMNELKAVAPDEYTALFLGRWFEPETAPSVEEGGILEGFEEAAPVTRQSAWKAIALCGENKKPAAVLANVAAALRLDERISDCFAFDEMAVRPVLLKALPGEPVLRKHRFVEDNDLSRLQIYLQVEGLTRLGRDTVKQGVLLRASEGSFHPVRDYLERTKWDETPRIAGWLSRYLGAEQKPYHDRIGALFLISMVARVMEPGCQSDHMLVLEGEQGEQKSTACAVLAGEWFSDSLPDVRDGKDVSIHLAGRWLVEVAEMSAMSKADHAALKAFISRRVERYRPPFGTFEVDQPRQVTFIGTTNSKAYLRDETGGRRFWPVLTGQIDIAALRRDRDQLFAEALARYRAGEPWWPAKDFERKYVKPEQEARFEVDAWEESIVEWVGKQTAPFLVSEVARGPLGIHTPKIGTSEQRRITAALERLGYDRMPKDRVGNVRWSRRA